MARFNTAAKEKTVLNHEGEKAYSLSPAMELYTVVVTSMFSDKFYESKDQTLTRLRDLIKKVDPIFVAKLAVYAREEMNLRTMPLILVVELAKIHNGDDLVSKTVARVIQRVDELTEILAYYKQANELPKIQKLSHQMQKGVAQAFLKFDEYQFAKYDRAGQFKLRDALFLSHVKADTNEKKLLFTRIIDGTLETPYTWETEISTKGNNAEVWSKLIQSGRFPYMAAMRNLRNILNAKVDTKDVSTLSVMLADPKNVANSRQLPFRYLSAYRELKDNDSPLTAMLLGSLDSAIQSSAQNVKGFDSNVTVAIAADVSSSMQTPISDKSTVQNYDIGLLLGMILQHRCKSVVSGIFGDTFKIINLPQTNILENVLELHRREGEVGYSTNGYLVLDGLEKKKIKADKIMMFTDNQMWNSNLTADHMAKSWASYKKFYPNAKLYLFDLEGYGNTPVSTIQKDVYLIAGWSEKVFDVLDAYDKGSNAISHIEKISI